jgi:hypothetical protein
LGVNPSISLGYLMVGAVLLACRQLEREPAADREIGAHGARPALAE